MRKNTKKIFVLQRTEDHIKDIMAYANAISTKKIPACIYIKSLCDDFLAELNNKKSEYIFDEKKAIRAINFIEKMVHVKGEWTGKPLKIAPWQKFFVGNIFGWYKKDGVTRRYTEAALIVPRKNAKSTLSAAIGHYFLVGDNELGSEVYCGATTEEQAFTVFNIARSMAVINDPYVASFKLTYTKELISADSKIDNRRSLSSFKPIIGAPKDGSNPKCAIVDEYHEHPTDKLYDSLKNGMGARNNPMLMVTTTAGTDVKGPCFRYVEAGRKVVLGQLKNPDLFYMEYTVDEGDDWKDINSWVKANPGVGDSVKLSFLESQLNVALTRPDKTGQIKTKHLNIWTNESVGWINYEDWKECYSPLKLEDFEGEECFCGVDLASKIDLTSLILIFKRDDEYFMFGRHYLPSATVEKPDCDHYRVFRDMGWLTVTEGARTDYHVVEEDLQKFSERFRIKELAYDQREAEYLMQNIREWAPFPCIEFVQSAANFSEPMKEFEALYLDRKLHHENDAIINWAASNVVLKSTTNKLIYISKSSDLKKIDPIAAAIMALARAKAVREEEGGDPFVWVF